MPPRFIVSDIDAKWQRRWADDRLYEVDLDRPGDKWYFLTMYPYPSGDLHVGHWYPISISDAMVRYLRMTGKNVFFPHGIRRLRASGGERRYQARRAAAHVDHGEHRAYAGPAPRHGYIHRLEQGDRDLRARILSVEPVAVPQVLRKRFGVSRPGRRLVVSQRQDRARQRAGAAGR